MECLIIVAASYYSTIINPHTIYFTTERTKSSQSAVSSPVSSASMFTFKTIFLPSDYRLETRLIPRHDSQAGGHLTPTSCSSDCRLETRLIPRLDSQAGGHLTPTSCSSDCRLETQLIPRLDSQVGGQLTPTSYSSDCRLETQLITSLLLS
jgi:hypothetical protein